MIMIQYTLYSPVMYQDCVYMYMYSMLRACRVLINRQPEYDDIGMKDDIGMAFPELSQQNIAS